MRAARVLILAVVMLVLPASSCGLRVKSAEIKVSDGLAARSSFIIQNQKHAPNDTAYINDWRGIVERCGGHFRLTAGEYNQELPIQVLFENIQSSDRSVIIGCIGESNARFNYDIRAEEGFLSDDIIIEFEVDNQLFGGDLIPARIVIDMPGSIQAVEAERRSYCFPGSACHQAGGRRVTISTSAPTPTRQQMEECGRSLAGLPPAEQTRMSIDHLRVRVVSRIWSIGFVDMLSLLFAILALIPLIYLGVRRLVRRFKKRRPASA